MATERKGRLDLQLHVKRGSNQTLMAVKNDMRVKPTGGFWTSTYTPDAEHLSGWVQWCASEMPEWISDIGLIYEVADSARILIVDTVADMNRIFDRYGLVKDLSPSYKYEYLDFERIAQEFDGMNMTEEGQWRTRMTHPRSFYGWDCESTLWFSMASLTLKEEIKLQAERMTR